jgi:ankyrin repeat protein
MMTDNTDNTDGNTDTLPSPRNSMQTSAATALVDQPTGLLQLPLDLLTLIITSAAAPLTICKGTSAVISSQESVATWLLNSSKRYPLLTAARHQQWDACMAILGSQCKLRLYDLNHTLLLAAQAGKLQLVTGLLQKGGWAKWEWNTDKPRVRPDTRAQVYYRDDQEREAATGYIANEKAALQQLEHPLIAAAGAGHLDVCSLLLQPEERPVNAPLWWEPVKNITIHIKHEALRAAAEHGRLPVMRLIVAREPTISKPGLSESALCSAAKGSHLPVVQYLLDQGADPNNRQKTLWSSETSFLPNVSRVYNCPLVAAAAGGNPAVMQLLLDRGATVVDCWYESLTAAAGGGHLQAVHLLLSMANTGVDGNTWQKQWAQTKQGPTAEAKEPAGGMGSWRDDHEQYLWVQHQMNSPLHHAAQGGHMEVLQLLLQCGHDCGCKEHALAAAACHGHLHVMQLLLQHGADVNGCCNHERPYPAVTHRKQATGCSSRVHQKPMYAAIQGRQAAALQLLIKAGATVGQEQLVLAAEHSQAGGLVQFLLNLGIQDTEDRALIAAAMRRQPSWPVVQLLLFSSTGGTSNLGNPDEWHRRVLMTACAAAGQCNLDIVQQLFINIKARTPAGNGVPAKPRPVLDQLLCAAAGAVPKFVHPIYGWSAEFAPDHHQSANRQHVIALLVKLGADVNAEDSAPLRAAVKAHDTALVKFLWEQGANGKGDDGQLLGTSLVNGPQRPAYPPALQHMLRRSRMLADL